MYLSKDSREALSVLNELGRRIFKARWLADNRSAFDELAGVGRAVDLFEDLGDGLAILPGCKIQ